MPKRAVFETSRRELSFDVSVGGSHPLGCGAIEPGVYGVCQDSDTSSIQYTKVSCRLNCSSSSSTLGPIGHTVSELQTKQLSAQYRQHLQEYSTQLFYRAKINSLIIEKHQQQLLSGGAKLCRKAYQYKLGL